MENNIISFLLEIGKLKRAKRTGWVLKGIKNSESVAEHTFRTIATILLFGNDKDTNRDKLIKMGVFRHLGETSEKVNGLVWEHGTKISNEKKIRKETTEFEVAKSLLSVIPHKQDEYLSLIKEYHEGKTKEAKWLRQVEKLEMAIQAFEYETENNRSFDEFFENAEYYIKDSQLRKIFLQLKGRRKND